MKRFTNRRMILVGAVLLVVIGAGVALAYSRKKPVPKSPPKVAVNPSPTNPTAQQTVTANPDVPGGETGSNSTVDNAVYPPYGTFVSNYNPNLSDQEQSTCNTTPGATCVITFTKDGVTKSLDAKVVTSDPKESQTFASWTWMPGDIGLTAGSWTVAATASLSGHQNTTTSSKLLEVRP